MLHLLSIALCVMDSAGIFVCLPHHFVLPIISSYNSIVAFGSICNMSLVPVCHCAYFKWYDAFTEIMDGNFVIIGVMINSSTCNAYTTITGYSVIGCSVIEKTCREWSQWEIMTVWCLRYTWSRGILLLI